MTQVPSPYKVSLASGVLDSIACSILLYTGQLSSVNLRPSCLCEVNAILIEWDPPHSLPLSNSNFSTKYRVTVTSGSSSTTFYQTETACEHIFIAPCDTTVFTITPYNGPDTEDLRVYGDSSSISASACQSKIADSYTC